MKNPFRSFSVDALFVLRDALESKVKHLSVESTKDNIELISLGAQMATSVKEELAQRAESKKAAA